MTANNPPIAAWAPSTALHKLESRHNNAPCILTDGPAEFNDVALVRLSDYEALQAELARELQRRFDGNEQASREHREDVKALVEALVAAQKEAVRGISHARNGAQAAAALGRVSAICGAALAAMQRATPC